MLSYKDHTKDCWTERQTFYNNLPEGDLVYDSLEGTTVERLEDGLRIKVQLLKDTNWLQLADQLSCEVHVLTDWARQLRRKKITFDQMEVLERDQEKVDEIYRQFQTEADPTLYMYFYDDTNWVIYDNDHFYLFVFDLSFDNNYLGASGMEGLSFTPHDCLCGVYSWLRRWYHRVTGYQEMD